MNKARRKELECIMAVLEGQVSELGLIMDEEQMCFDNLTEGLQATERGQTMEENVNDLDTIITDLQNVIDSIQDIINR
jgi:uncharacterized coiled-coil protein SlyX